LVFSTGSYRQRRLPVESVRVKRSSWERRLVQHFLRCGHDFAPNGEKLVQQVKNSPCAFHAPFIGAPGSQEEVHKVHQLSGGFIEVADDREEARDG
jgi:hypothetical protein